MSVNFTNSYLEKRHTSDCKDSTQNTETTKKEVLLFRFICL